MAEQSVFRIGDFEARVIRKALRNETKRADGVEFQERFEPEEYEHALVLIGRLNKGIKEKRF